MLILFSYHYGLKCRLYIVFSYLTDLKFERITKVGILNLQYVIDIDESRLNFYLMPSAENSGQINRKFGVEFLGDAIANLYQSKDNISNFE